MSSISVNSNEQQVQPVKLGKEYSLIEDPGQLLRTHKSLKNKYCNPRQMNDKRVELTLVEGQKCIVCEEYHSGEGPHAYLWKTADGSMPLCCAQHPKKEFVQLQSDTTVDYLDKILMRIKKYSPEQCVPIVRAMKCDRDELIIRAFEKSADDDEYPLDMKIADIFALIDGKKATDSEDDCNIPSKEVERKSTCSTAAVHDGVKSEQNINAEFMKFINSRESDPAVATHFYAPTKKYFQVSTEDQPQFWIYYCDAVAAKQNPSIYEINNDDSQLGFELQLSFGQPQTLESVDEYAQRVIAKIQATIQDMYEPTEKGSEYVASYLRPRYQQSVTSYKGKIIFPYARVENQHMERFTDEMIKAIACSCRPQDHFTGAKSDHSTMLKPITKNFPLYDPGDFVEHYGWIDTDTLHTFDTFNMFIPGLHELVKDESLSTDVFESKMQQNDPYYWLPLLFSNQYYVNPLSPSNALLCSREQFNEISQEPHQVSELEKAQTLLSILNPSRADYYWSWIDVGQALHSVDLGEAGLNLWKYFTQRGSFKSADDCDMLWDNFESKDVTIETLEYFALQDNPQQFEAFREKEIQEAIDQALAIQEGVPVAKAFKACFPHNFICSSYQKRVWYYYDNHHWSLVDGPSLIIWYLTEKFKCRLDQMQAKANEEKENTRDTEKKNRLQQRVTQIGQLIQKLSRQHFLRNVCDAAMIYYHKPNFGQIKNSANEFTATPTGVIDLRGNYNMVRPGKPEDYIDKITNVGYRYDYNWDHRAVSDVLNYIKQVFRSRTLRDYFWRFSSSLLVSGNANKLFPIFSGQGNNSKSMLVRLFEFALGRYAVKLPTSLITDKRTAADSATPTLIHSQGAKVAFLEEPNKNESIQSGTVKHMTGRDTQYVRDLFQKGSELTEMNVTITPVLIANKIPAIPDCQEAIWARTRVLEFSSKWSDNAPNDPEEQFRQGLFKMNIHFDNEIKSMGAAFLWILVHKYSDYISQGLNDPPEVLQATENFRVMNNNYIHFTRDCITTVLTDTGERDMTAAVGLDELFNSFKQWWKGQELAGKIPTKTDFKNELETVWKTKMDSDKKWYGLRLNEQKHIMQSMLTF